jgi:hypothetical protein
MRISFLVVVVGVHVDGDETIRDRGAQVPGFLGRVVGGVFTETIRHDPNRKRNP